VQRKDRVNWLVRYVEGDMAVDAQRRLREVVEAVPEPLAAEMRASWLERLSNVVLACDGSISSGTTSTRPLGTESELSRIPKARDVLMKLWPRVPNTALSSSARVSGFSITDRCRAAS
jgi:hypothetical protein